MMNDPTSNGVVDPAILDVQSDDMAIPPYLQRQPEAHEQPSDVVAQATIDALPEQEVQPEFTTQVDDEGQTELVVSDTHAGNEVSNDTPYASQQEAIQEHERLHEEAQAARAVPSHHNMAASPEEMRRDFFKDVNKFGKASGEGASALGRLGLRALRAAADGILSTAKPQGGGKDDATLVYEAYAAMDSKHAEHTAGGAKANASKLRQIIGMGCMTTISDPVAIGDKVVRIREEMEAADLKPKALFAGLVDVARDQQASDTELTDDAIRGALTKTKADKTLEKEWEAISKKVDALVTGESPHGLKDQSEAALKISELVHEHVKNYKLGGKRDDLIEALMEQGYSHAMAVNIVDKRA